jgi:cytidylate kinase
MLGAELYPRAMVIAIDGPAGAGKSTVAQGVARALGFAYLDSGAMYRCVGLAALRAGVDLNDENRVAELARAIEIDFSDGRVSLDGADVTEEIRTAEVGEAASRVAAQPEVRAAMVERQRGQISRGRYVAEGRDIGTVVSPDAALKVFLTASPEERAGRRSAESGDPAGGVLEALRERDRRDRERDHGPLRPAEDAVEVDTTGLPVDEVVERVVALARERGVT